MNIEDDPKLLEFFDSRDLAQGTVKTYLVRIKDYCKFTGLTPSELIQEADKEEEEGVKLRDRSIKKHLIQYKKHLQNQDKSELTILTTISLLRSFYNEFEISLPRTRSKRVYMKKQRKEDLPDKEDIIHALQFANLKYRAIILLMASSGMGISEVVSLTFQDFLDSIKNYVNHSTDVEEIQSILQRKVEDNELIISTWNITRIKTRMPYTTFSTYESIEAILLYLKSYPAIKGDHLFRSQQTDKKIPEKTMNNQFNIINYRAGFGKVDRQIFFRSHNLRKYFTNVLYKNKLRETSINWMLGHQIDSISESYFKSDIEDLKDDYVTCIPDLSMKNIEVDKVTTDDKKELIRIREEQEESKRKQKKSDEEIEMLNKKLILIQEDLERRKRLNEYPDLE